MATFARLTRPSHQAYANAHGYATYFGLTPTLGPPSWGKVPILRTLLDNYDAVLWLDADCLVVDASDDIGSDIGNVVQALARHVTPEGRIPNCGVWYLTQAARPMLDETLGLYGEYVNHRWWEQGAVIEMLSRGWDKRTHWLDPGWNRERHDTQTTERVRIEHFAGGPDVMGERLWLLRQRLAS
jgi:hypothetical protein